MKRSDQQQTMPFYRRGEPGPYRFHAQATLSEQIERRVADLVRMPLVRWFAGPDCWTERHELLPKLLMGGVFVAPVLGILAAMSLTDIFSSWFGIGMWVAVVSLLVSLALSFLLVFVVVPRLTSRWLARWKHWRSDRWERRQLAAMEQYGKVEAPVLLVRTDAGRSRSPSTTVEHGYVGFAFFDGAKPSSPALMVRFDALDTRLAEFPGASVLQQLMREVPLRFWRLWLANFDDGNLLALAPFPPNVSSSTVQEQTKARRLPTSCPSHHEPLARMALLVLDVLDERAREAQKLR